MLTGVTSWDRSTLLVTGLLGMISNHLDGVNLTLAIATKLVIVGNFGVYVLINWRRIWLNLKGLLRFLKLKK